MKKDQLKVEQVFDLQLHIFDFEYVLNFDKRNIFISCIDKLELRTFCTSSEKRLYRIPNNILVLKRFEKIASILTNK